MSSEGTPRPATPGPSLQKDWRLYAGITALILSCVMPLVGLAVPFLGLPVAWSAVLVGVLLAGGPEVLIVVAAILLGKETVHYFMATAKRKVLEALLVKPVSQARYYVGLTISVLSPAPLYLYGYFPGIMPADEARIYILAAADLSFVASVFIIMGGEFWEKLRSIFIWQGKAVSSG
jgi:hypothetical protein